MRSVIIALALLAASSVALAGNKTGGAKTMIIANGKILAVQGGQYQLESDGIVYQIVPTGTDKLKRAQVGDEYNFSRIEGDHKYLCIVIYNKKHGQTKEYRYKILRSGVDNDQFAPK